MVRKLIKHTLWRFRKEIIVIILAIVTLLTFIPVFTYVYFAKDLTTKEGIMNRNDTGLVLLDRNNKPFYTFYAATFREFVSLKEVPRVMQHAVIAAEDREFYQHPGFSIRGILRSLFLDLKEKDIIYGGSTITQQLVKNVLLTNKKSFFRKYQEIVLAQEIERRYKKPEILEMYLNSVYFGEGAFGIEQAAQTYFGKHTKDITLAEATLLAGILPAPSRYSPLSGDEKKAKDRQIIVLRAMRSLGYISSEEAQKAEKSELVYRKASDSLNTLGTHFALMVRDELVRKYGEEEISRSGFTVKTSLDIDWQKKAESVVYEQVENLATHNVTNGAAVVIDPKNGEVRALVGSKDWENDSFGKVNVADSPRSPGSSFKPIIYAAALEKKLITPATLLRDEPTTFAGNYKPQNYDRRFRGTVLARRALANSLNIPSVEVMSRVGVPEGLAMAERLGITSLKEPVNYGLSLVLGTGEVKLLELTNAYATFANKGRKYPLTKILQITDKHKKLIYSYIPRSSQVIEPSVAFLISSILSDANARREVFGNALDVSRVAAVKTGTAEDYRDALTVGFTPNLAVGVWVGNNDNSPMDQIAGSLGAAPIWRALIEAYSIGTPIEVFEPPTNVIATSVCTFNGLLAQGATSAAYKEYFIDGTQPVRRCISDRPTPSKLGEFMGELQQKREERLQEIREKREKRKDEKANGQGRPGNIDEIQQQLQQAIPQASDGAH